ncbi:MAG TPA: cupin domain-containing protein [Steroidobacteraceae bacterium]|nr:cupin domain-containing protein [Steroidobacteraceae bacterium]
MTCSIVALDGSIRPEISQPAPDRQVSGNPSTQISNYFSDASGQFFAGHWSASRGKWRIRYTENELCVMTSGKVSIESETGERCTFVAGDAFVVPAGFCGTWEVLEDCSKVYAVFEPRAPGS